VVLKDGVDEVSSDFLFVRPSFLRGFARALDLTGSLDAYNWSESSTEADAMATYVDWSLVGVDLANAMKQFAVRPVDRAGNEQLQLIEREAVR
jgi:hypothetical protein